MHKGTLETIICLIIFSIFSMCFLAVAVGKIFCMESLDKYFVQSLQLILAFVSIINYFVFRFVSKEQNLEKLEEEAATDLFR